MLLAFKLPVHTPEEMSFEQFIHHMMRDKKVVSEQLCLVLPVGIGKAKVLTSVTHVILKKAINFCRMGS